MTLEAWSHLIPADVYANLEAFGSAAHIPYLLMAAPALGKVPFCHDVTAAYWAQRILGGSYALETRDDYGLRHLRECREDECEWCDEERAFRCGTP
jgi:hypothetical protein